MAKMSYEMPDDFIRKLSLLQSGYDDVVGEVLKEGVKPLYDQAKSNLEKVIGAGTKEKSKSSGDLVKSLRTTKPYLDGKEDWQIKVGCTGYDRKGVANPLKAAVLEHGSSKQTAKPWVRPAAREAKSACIDAMQKALDEEVQKL